ncbi:MAG TPA: biopolymer transporter ExbD [Gemmatimonadaceae bacterium]|nr:biopolymer transporter ExbD [Gemmatimonadaceae bacterium]
MSVSTGKGRVKAEPNVVPMIDIMLVLLIIFMIVTPAIVEGFKATPPEGVNLKAHPKDEDVDQVLGIDATGAYFLNKDAIRKEDLPAALEHIYSTRTIDKVLYIKADKNLEYQKVRDAMEVASKHGVVVVAAITDQLPGTKSSVAGDILDENQ